MHFEKTTFHLFNNHSINIIMLIAINFYCSVSNVYIINIIFTARFVILLKLNKLFELRFSMYRITPINWGS